MNVSRRQVLGFGAALGAVSVLPGMRTARAAGTVAQVPFPGSSIPQFINPLPLLSVSGGPIPTIFAGTPELPLRMREFQTDIAAPGTFGPGVKTWVYGYVLDDAPGVPATTLPGSYIGPVIVASRGLATTVRWINGLGASGASEVPVWPNAGDQTLHWADPLEGSRATPYDEVNYCAHHILPGNAPTGFCAEPYQGPIPTVAHLHGGEVPPLIDGGPDAWFTGTGLQGHAYHAGPTGATVAASESVYAYPNTQEAAPLWFHDHVLGGTRLNVYAGLAGAYVLTDPTLSLPPGLHAVGLQQGSSGPVDFLVPLVLQDRSFDTNGQLLIPHVGINPEHPFWVPEFVGDTIVVNGKAWPFLNVAPRRYRFLLINGSNARAFELFVHNPATKAKGPALWQIGTDGGYLDAPVKIDPNAPKGQLDKLVLLPGERADVIIDFAGLENQTLVLRNSARHPYPKGDPPQGSTIGQVMVFRVVLPGPTTGDASYDPASGVPLRPAMVRLVDTAAGALATGITPQKTRLLTLNEIVGPGGPLEVLVNNTTWDGVPMNDAPRDDFTSIGNGEYVSEIPAEGETEVWEIVNLTADGHPIHLHLAQVQLINRQRFNVSKYAKAYNEAFPGNVFIPEYGPPLNYATGISRALGGNPDIEPYLQGPARPPDANEAGWKDTIRMLPGEVTRFVVRFMPTDVDAGDSGAYPFDPDAGGHGFVFHCHIIDHEDNEMMRPYTVTPDASATRTVTEGQHY